MGFLAILNAYSMRVCLSITITEMAPTTHKESIDDTCPYNRTISEDEGNKKDVKLYDWDEYTQVCERLV